jgi:hypothetical protein
MMAVTAGYIWMMSLFTNDQICFNAWFALVCWTSFPLVFTALAGCVTLLAAINGQIRLTEINPLSLVALLFNTTGPFKSMLQNLSLLQLWSMGLLVLGYQQWTGKSFATSLVISLMPTFLIYGIWALIILL